eukprot:GHVO01013939.1.p3 GENE.GHVO01013939.1~~GHVO01013939.1.p3  ORF type:complete len:101 (-),score=27.38 GHVO01013939.1:399-701(-)
MGYGWCMIHFHRIGKLGEERKKHWCGHVWVVVYDTVVSTWVAVVGYGWCMIQWWDMGGVSYTTYIQHCIIPYPPLYHIHHCIIMSQILLFGTLQKTFATL